MKTYTSFFAENEELQKIDKQKNRQDMSKELKQSLKECFKHFKVKHDVNNLYTVSLFENREFPNFIVKKISSVVNKPCDNKNICLTFDEWQNVKTKLGKCK